MSKRKHEEQELPFVALMDTMTNVVGVLIIVLVMVGLSVANIVKTVLSDLPPVTKEELTKLKEDSNKLPELQTSEEVQKKKEQLETDLRKVVEQLKTVDTSDMQSKMKFMDIDAFKKQLEERRKDRELTKAETDKILAEVERLKAMLDQTPEFKPPPSTYVRMPNPRPYPENPVVTQVFVARQGVITFNEANFMKPIYEGMEKIKSQLEYQKAEFKTFKKLLESILGSPEAAQKAWPEIEPLVSHVQLEEVARAYKVLESGGIPPTKRLLADVADLHKATSKLMPVVAEAIIAATKNDFSKWVECDPNPKAATPNIKVVASRGKVTFSWKTQSTTVNATLRGILGYFEDLAKREDVKDKSKSTTIYEASRIEALLKRVASNPLLAGSYAFEPKVIPTETLVQIVLTPKTGGLEAVESIKQPNSPFIHLMRDVKGDPNGVVIFKVMKDAFVTYHEARKLADEVGVPAAWEFFPEKLDLKVEIKGYVVQRTESKPPAAPRAPGAAPVKIEKPKRSLD